MNYDILIKCAPHGVAGAAVKFNENELTSTITLTKLQFNKKQCRKLHLILSSELTNMLPQIMLTGTAVDRFGETYDTEKFDNDLVLLAIYDNIGNNKKINWEKI